MRNRQGNAADPKQVKTAGRQAERRQQRFVGALQTILASVEGRIVIWELLSRAGVYQSIWDPSARIHYNAGRQDFGHELLAECIDADERGYLAMETEARAYARSEANESAAARTRAVTEGDSNDESS